MALSDKYGIITFHNAVNYGAALQTYALEHFLNQNDVCCEVIDYVCPKIAGSYTAFRRYGSSPKDTLKALIKMPVNLQKKRKFARFLKKNVVCSDVSYTPATIGECSRVYDGFIAGSDQVWNLDLTGDDLNYFLKFAAKGKKRFSYAASMGGTDLTDSKKQLLAAELDRMDCISVREEDAQQFLRALLKREVSVVLDPVFLLDGEEWASIAPASADEAYIFVYCLHEDEVYEAAEKLAHLTGLKIVCVQNHMKKPINARYILSAGPDEFVSYIRNAEYVVTDSFHGAAFSILFRKNLKVLLKKKKVGLNGRMNTLLRMFSLKDAVVDRNSADELLLAQTEYEETAVREAIEQSKNYLLRMVKGTME